MNKTALFGFLILTAICFCDKDAPTPPKGNDYEIGKNRFTTVVDGDEREYYVHVPSSYNPNSPTPVVFMLHGTTGDGERFYNISGWKEVGEAENILTVYPGQAERANHLDQKLYLQTTTFNASVSSFASAVSEREGIRTGALAPIVA